MIMSGNAAAYIIKVIGPLDFSNNTTLTELPPDLYVTHLTLDNCSSLETLPRGLRCQALSLQGTPIKSLPDDIQVTRRLDLSHCDMLTALPDSLRVGELLLTGCTALRALPPALDVVHLDIAGCVGLTSFPAQGPAVMGSLNMSGCTRISELPAWLTFVAQLNIAGCSSLTTLPEHLTVSQWLDLMDTPITAIPARMKRTQLRWRSVAINEQIAFHPETLEVSEILNEVNTERRRVMIERFGNEAFMEKVNAELLDEDRDAGGQRRLLLVPLLGDEPLVGLSVLCPSTGRNYLLRVPPTMKSCRQAAAWIAGFDDPEKYFPLVET